MKKNQHLKLNYPYHRRRGRESRKAVDDGGQDLHRRRDQESRKAVDDGGQDLHPHHGDVVWTGEVKDVNIHLMM